MHAIFAVIPLAIIARAQNEGKAVTDLHNIQISSDNLAVKLVDRVLNVWAPYSANLEEITLVKTRPGGRQGTPNIRREGGDVPLTRVFIPNSPSHGYRTVLPIPKFPVMRNLPISQAQVTDLQRELAIPKAGTVHILLGKECRLQISFLPEFRYDAECGGEGRGEAAPVVGIPNRLALNLDPRTITIPPPPPPPGVVITTHPSRFAGFLDVASGDIELRFEAEYDVAGPFELRKTLQVEATLMTQSKGGRKLDADGRAALAGVARVPETGDALVDKLLLLPSEVAVVFEAAFEFGGHVQQVMTPSAPNSPRKSYAGAAQRND